MVTRPSADPTRDRILAAAVDLFSERSFKGATTREIARAGRRDPAAAQLPLPVEGRAVAGGGRLAVRHAPHGRWPTRVEGLRGVDDLTSAKLLVREFITFSARNPQLHRIITQECKADGPRMDHLVEHHVRPLYEGTVALFEQLARDGAVPADPGAAPLLHPHRRRSDDVRARSRVPAAERARPHVRRGHRGPRRRRLPPPLRRRPFDEA